MSSQPSNQQQQSQTPDKKTQQVNPVLEELQKYLVDLKNFNVSKYCASNLYLDVVDSRNQWCVGKVVNIDQKGFMDIRFDGWSDKYIEKVFVHSRKIDAFRKYTIPYTGAVKTTCRDDLTLDKMREEVNQQLEEMSNLDNDEFNITDVHGFIQYFRGKLFFLGDNILCFNKSYTDKDLNSFIEFFQTYIRLFIKYLKTLPSVLPTYIEALNLNKFLYLVCPKVGIASGYAEIFYMMNSLFGGEPRCQKFYKNNRFEFNQHADPFVIKSKEGSAVSQEQILNFINYFGMLYGFDTLFDLISWEQKGSQDVIYQTPIPIIKCIVEIFVKCLSSMPGKKQQLFATNLKKRVFDRFNKVSDRELKDIDIYKVKSTISTLGESLAQIYGNAAFEETEKLEIKCIIKLIKCPFLEKKILGIFQFKEVISRACANNRQFYSKDIYPYQYFDKTKLKEYLEQENLLDFLLGENFHSEIFKRSIEILGFLSEERALQPKHIEMIWKLTENKHEADLSAIYSVIIDLSKQLSEQSLNQLYKYISAIPYDQYTELTINLVKEFTINASSSINPSYQTKSQLWKNKINVSQEFPNFGLQKLWSCIQDNNKVNNQLVSACVDALSELLKTLFFSSYKEQYLQQCFENLKNGTSVPQSLQLAIIILKTYPSSSTFLGVGESNAESITQKYNKEFNFLDLLVKDFEAYMKAVLQKLKRNGIILDEKQGEEVFVGKYGHVHNIDIRLEFISLVSKYLSNKGKDITIDQLKKLWKILVRSSITTLEKNKFLTWMVKKKIQNNDNNYNNNNKNPPSSMLDENVLSSALEQIFCDKELMNGFQIDKEIFDCLKNIFQMVNLKNRSIELNNQNLILVNKHDQIVGKEVFWNISLFCIDNIVLEEVRQLLVSIHMRKTLKSQEVKAKMWSKFTDKCYEILAQTKSPQVQSHIVLMIKIFLQEIEGKHFFGDRRQEMTILVTILGPNNTVTKRSQLKLQSNISILKLRKEIAREFKLTNKDFDMTFQNKKIPLNKVHEEEHTIDALSTNDDQQLPHIVVQNIKDTNQDLIELTQFKHVLANSQFAEILLDFLSTGQSDDIVNNAWDILNLLPKNIQIVKQLQSIELDDLNSSSWNTLLPSNCFRKLQYFFLIISQEFLRTGMDGTLRKDQDQWCQALIQKGGLRHILSIYLNLCNETNFEKPFNLYCFSTLVEIIGVLMRLYYKQYTKEFLVENNSKLSDKNEFLNIIVQRTINYIGFGLKKSDQFFNPTGNSLMSSTISINQLASSIMVNGNRIANDSNLSVNRLLIQTYLLSFFKGTFELLSQCFEQDESLIKTYLIEQSQNFTPIFQGLLILDDDQIRNELQNSLVKVIDLDNTNQAHMIFEKNLSQIIITEQNHIQTSYRSTCYEFFQLYQQILKHLEVNRLIGTSVNPKSFISTLQTILNLIKACNAYERNRQDVDGMLRGTFQCLQQLIQMDGNLAEIVIKDESLIQSIVYECLFSIKTDENPEAPKCKSRQSRQSAFSFLVALQDAIIKEQQANKDILNGGLDVNQQINEFFKNAHWRTKSKADWNIKEEQEKEENCPIGLKNLGCTCYMNSLIQQLFMIRDFSDSVLKIDPTSSEKEYNPKENVLYQVQQIFSALSFSQRQYYDPRDFCQAFKDLDGQPTNVLQQMDVDEFFNTLMDRLETLLKPSKNDFIIKSVFEGQLANELIGKGQGCTHTSEREESFLAVSLPTKSKKTLHECLQSFVQGEMLDGDNSYFCEKCDKKVPTLKRQSIKKLPNQLIIVLKRFHFDLDTMQKIKINSYCEFPDKLNLKQYSQAYLKQKDREEEANQQANGGEQDSNAKSNDKKGEDQEDNQLQDELFDDDYYKYNLRGVVIHQGTSDSGHYYSLIKQQDEKWLEFNDTYVRQFDVNDLPAEAFGGEQDMQFNNNNGNNQSMNLNNSKMQNVNNKNAYLLFYERDVFFNNEGVNISSILDQNLIQNPTNIVKDNIISENQKLHLNKYLFSTDMIDYTANLLKIIDTNNQPEYSTKVAKFLIKYYFFCRQRQFDRSSIPSFRRKLGELISKNYDLSVWLLSQVSNESFIKENFLDCQTDEMKYLGAGLIIEAINTICAQESNLPYETFVKKSVMINFMNMAIYIIHVTAGTDHKMLDQFFRIFCRVTEISKNAKIYLLKQKMVGRLQAAILGVKIFNNGNGYQDGNSYKLQGQNEKSEFGLDQSIELEKSQKIQSIDEFLEGKERNKRLAQMQKNASYLTKMHSLLVRSVSVFNQITIPENINLALPRIDHFLDSDEIESFKNAGYIKQLLLLNVPNKKMVRNYLGMTYAYLTAENPTLTEELINSWFNIYSETKYEDQLIKVFFVFLKHYLLLNDSQEKKRVKLVKQKVQNFIMQNYRVFYAGQMAVDAMIKFSTISKGFGSEMFKEIQGNKEFQRALELFLNGSNNIFNALNNNQMSLFRDNRQFNLNVPSFQKYQQNIKSMTNVRKNKISSLENLSQAPLEYDSDDDQAEKIFKVGDKVDYKVNGEISAYFVSETMGDMFQITSEEDKSQNKWVKYDDDCLVEASKAAKYYQYFYDYIHF